MSTPGSVQLFRLYNWSYKIMCVFAHSIEEARQIAIDAGHVRGGRPFKRIVEFNPDADDMTSEAQAALQRALERGHIGVVNYDEQQQEWHFVK